MKAGIKYTWREALQTHPRPLGHPACQILFTNTDSLQRIAGQVYVFLLHPLHTAARYNETKPYYPILPNQQMSTDENYTHKKSYKLSSMSTATWSNACGNINDTIFREKMELANKVKHQDT